MLSDIDFNYELLVSKLAIENKEIIILDHPVYELNPGRVDLKRHTGYSKNSHIS